MDIGQQFLALDAPLAIRSWLPDETLFSLASRYHQISGNTHSGDTCRQLFGHTRQGALHDLPGNIGEFARRTGGILGEATEIARRRTVLAPYLPFLPHQAAVMAISALIETGVHNLKARLGLLTKGQRANHPLRACAACMQADKIEHCTMYWHREHQLPAVWVCPIHMEPLHTSDYKSEWLARYRWGLPIDPHVHLLPSGAASNDATIDAALQVANIAIKLANLTENFRFSETGIARCYRQGLTEKGFGDVGQESETAQAQHAYYHSLKSIQGIAPSSALPSSAEAAGTHIRRALDEKNLSPQIHRHVALIRWLFEDFDTFLTRYSSIGGDHAASAVDQRLEN